MVCILAIIPGLLQCSPANEDFDPRRKYGKEVRSFSQGNMNELPYFVGPDSQPVWKDGRVPEGAIRISEFKFTDQHGAGFGSSSLKNKIYLANFFFTECSGICPQTMPRLRRVQEKLKGLQEFVMVSYSVTPEQDTPEVLKEYAERLNIHGQWHLLTGSRNEIYSLARESFQADTKVRSRKGADDFLHSEQAFLVDRQGYLRGIYNVQGPGNLEVMERDIRLLQGSP